MNSSVLWLQVGLLTAEVLTTAFLFVIVFRTRRVLGYVPLYVAVGAFQFVQTLLSLSVYVPFGESIQISPGSTVMLPATIFAVILVYIAEDAPEARRLIYGVVIANIALSILAVLFGGHLAASQAMNGVELPADIFWRQPRVMFFATAAMFMDVVLVIVFYEAVSKVIGSKYLQLLISTVAVLWLDTLVFVTGTSVGQPEFFTILVSGIIGKTFAASLYAGVFAVFVLRPGLHLEDVAQGDGAEIKDFFQALTYRQRYEQAREMALRDPLTGLYNRRFFQDTLARETEHSLRYRTPLALLVMDIDFFKTVNDKYGHQEGDRALRVVAEAIAHTVRGSDIACRVGGEEFAVIAPRATEDDAKLLAERVRNALSEDYAAADPPFGMDDLTLTVGLAEMTGNESDPVEALPDKLFQIADRRLYLGKATGRNRIVGWQAEAEPPVPARQALARGPVQGSA